MARKKSGKSRKKQGKSGRKSSGGMLTGMRGGMKSLAGQGPKKKDSLLSRVLFYVLLAAVAALLVYRFTR